MIHLHIGAHKTATTFLQDFLDLNRGKLYRAGTIYWPLTRLRPMIAHEIWMRRDKHGLRLKPLLRRQICHRHPFGSFDSLLVPGRDIILSDENMPGPPGHSLKGTLYPQAERRMKAISAALGKTDVQIWLSVRSYPTFLASLYGEALRNGKFAPQEQFVANYLDPAGQWPGFVRTVHAAFPEARIILWRYEDFQKLLPTVIERLCGLSLDEMIGLIDNPVRPGCSRQAIELQVERAPQLDTIDRGLSMAELEFHFPPQGPDDRFDPWSENQKSRMVDAYEADIKLLEALDYVDMLKP